MKKLICFTTILVLFAGWAYAEEITILTEDYPPYNYEENGTVTGFTTEIVEHILNETGIQAVGGMIKLYPWARAYQKVLKEKDVLLFTMTRNEKRENLFKWVGPFANREIWLYKLKTRKDFKIDTLKDAKRYASSVVREAAITNYMLELGFSPQKNLEIVPNTIISYRKFLAGRMDLIAASPISMHKQLNLMGKHDDIVEKAYLLDSRYNYYLAFSKTTSDNIVNRFQKALDRMKQDGTYGRLKKKYLK